MAVPKLFSSLESLYPRCYNHLCMLKSNFLSVETYVLIGEAFGKGMVEVLEMQKK